MTRLRVGRRGHLLFLALALFGWSRVARADESIPVRLTLDAPAGCSTSEELYQALRKRSERVRLAAPGERGFDVQVRLEQVGASVHGELSVVSDSGDADTRTVEGSTCGVVVEALSLTASLALDAADERERQQTAEEPAGGAAPQPPASTEDQAESERTPEPTTDEPTEVQVELGAQVVVASILSPEVSAGGALVARIVADPHEVVSPSFGVALTYAGAELGDAESQASVRWLAVTLSACPFRFGVGSVFGVRPCVLGAAGQVEASGEGLNEPQAVRRSWWSAGGALRLDARVGKVALELEGGLTKPLVERTFVAKPSMRILAESPEISAIGSLGFVYVF